jgi:hypothetical protein
MKRFMVGADRGQSTLLPECLDDWIDESNPVRAVDAFVDALNLAKLGFEGVAPEVTGRPSYHPSALLKLYIYRYLNRVQSSRWLEREAGRNLEVIWLLGPACLAPGVAFFADLDPPQTFALRADETLGNERQTGWRSGPCNSISRADHAAGLRDPTPHWTDPRLAPSKGTRLRNMWGPILIVKG